MNITHHTEPFHAIEIVDLYTEQEYQTMFDEILNHTHTFLDKEFVGTAKDESGEGYDSKKIAKWWDDLYFDRNDSKLLKLNRKLFNALDNCSDTLWFFKYKKFNHDTTLISYYEDGDYYNPHSDTSYLTALTWFWKEPKNFKGGNLVFPDYDLKIELKQNYTIIFPSNILHAVEPIEMIDKSNGDYYGRFSMTQFVNYNNPQNNSGN